VFRQGYEVHIQSSVLSCFVWDQGVSISTISHPPFFSLLGLKATSTTR